MADGFGKLDQVAAHCQLPTVGQIIITLHFEANEGGVGGGEWEGVGGDELITNLLRLYVSEGT